MQNPDNLRVAGESLELADKMFDYTEEFPRTQRFVLVGQMQRAAVSVGSNIYEACGRQPGKPFIASIYHSMAEASELDFQLRLSRRRGFGDPELAAILARDLTGMKRSLALLIKNQR